MTKFLLAIVLLFIGVKLMADSSAFVHKYDLAKYAELGEEEKGEVKEQGKTKHSIDDKMCFYFVLNPSLSCASVYSSKINLQQDTYISFVDKPKTPPPDIQ